MNTRHVYTAVTCRMLKSLRTAWMEIAGFIQNTRFWVALKSMGYVNYDGHSAAM
jgi:hypothetical protein